MKNESLKLTPCPWNWFWSPLNRRHSIHNHVDRGQVCCVLCRFVDTRLYLLVVGYRDQSRILEVDFQSVDFNFPNVEQELDSTSLLSTGNNSWVHLLILTRETWVFIEKVGHHFNTNIVLCFSKISIKIPKIGIIAPPNWIIIPLSISQLLYSWLSQHFYQ